MNITPLILGIGTLIVFSIFIGVLYISRSLALCLTIFLVVCYVAFASSAVRVLTPGDYNNYILFFDACTHSVERCFISNRFEPGFLALTIVLTSLLGFSAPDAWSIIVLIQVSCLALAIWIFSEKNTIRHNRIVSVLAISFAYSFTNFTTLSIRFGFSASLLFLALSIVYKTKKQIDFFICQLLMLAAILIHSQSLFIVPLILLYVRSISTSRLIFIPAIRSYKLPFLNGKLRRSAIICGVLFIGVLMLLIPNIQFFLPLVSKSHYLSVYKASTLGFRPFVEAIIVFFLAFPVLSNRVIPFSHISNLLYINVHYVTFSAFCSIIFMFFFSIDGFSRQVQFCFLLFMLLQRNIDLRVCNFSKISFLIVPFYVLLVNFYALYRDVSFAGSI